MIFRIIGTLLILAIGAVAYLNIDEGGSGGVQSAPVPPAQPGNDAFQNLKM